MTPDELDTALEELEIRLERLRALYEQYFLGIEKIEPTVARKDVDRRIWLLRREHIRNTARRFRLQTVVMRYNTFQQYWQRVCRDIENGTYIRHLLRAEKNVGPTEGLTIAAKRRLGMFRRGAEKRSAREGAAEDADREPSSELGEGPPARPGKVAAARPARPAPPLEQLDLDMDFLDAKQSVSGKRSRTPAPTPAAAATPAAPTSGPVTTAAPLPRQTAGRPNPLSRFSASAKRPEPIPPPTAAAAGLSRPAADRAARLAGPAVRSTQGAPQTTAGVSDEQVRDLQARLVDAKRRVNDGGNVSFDGLAKTLRAAETKLRERHGDRRIDFDVVIKDGKAVVKPILR